MTSTASASTPPISLAICASRSRPISEEIYVSGPAVMSRMVFIVSMTFWSFSSPSKDTVSSAAELTKCAVESSKVTPVTCGSSAISSATAFARS